MCTTCGCGGDHAHTHTHIDENGNVITHTHAHEHDAGHHVHTHTHVDENGVVVTHSHEHEHDAEHHHDHGHPHTHETATKTVSVGEDILARNNRDAARLRETFRAEHILALNFVSSPGSGKTELLSSTVRLAKDLGRTICVIEGDQQTDNDASRIREAGARAVQINTGKGCHLEAAQVEMALTSLKPEAGSILFIENVGNLVCPAEFDLGEAHKVAVISVTEGDDKPLKYPDMFAASDLMIINKIDLLPYVKFDIDRCEENARRVNPKIRVLRLSATTHEGMDKWLSWLKAESILAGL